MEYGRCVLEVSGQTGREAVEHLALVHSGLRQAHYLLERLPAVLPLQLAAQSLHIQGLP